MRKLRDRVRTFDGPRLDVLVAVAILIELELESWLDHGIAEPHRVPTAIAAVLFITPLAIRRRWPAGALVCCSALATIQELLGGRLSATSGLGMMLALVLLAYSAGAWLDSRDGLAAVILASAAFSGFVFRSQSTVAGGIDTALFFAALAFAAPWALGRFARERHRRADAFHELAAQAAAERDQRKRAAVAHERLRIGGDLQDIVAHSVSAMVIQAGGARQLLRSDPERARDSILAIERTGREALGDLRSLLGMLRRDSDPRALAPQPGLEQLPSLLDIARQAGLACALQIEGAPTVLTPGIDLVSYRVIETGLRIAADHGCGDAVIRVRYEHESLRLEMRGDRPIPALERALQSMVDRVALYSGSLTVQSAEGFVLAARLPLDPVAAA
jgi:signal transduction histidine kinase